jgi:hypothetical protein
MSTRKGKERNRVQKWREKEVTNFFKTIASHMSKGKPIAPHIDGRCLMGQPTEVEKTEQPKKEVFMCCPTRQHVTVMVSYHGQSL